MCAEVDLLHIQNLKKELFKLIPLQEIAGEKKDISFGLMNDDWDRLANLAKQLPDDSILKSGLVKAFRLLIAALYQAHSKPIFQRCYDQGITTSSKNVIIQGNKPSNNISNQSTNSFKDKDDLEGHESANWPRQPSFTTGSVKQVNDEIDYVAAGSDNQETEVSYQNTSSNHYLNQTTIQTYRKNVSKSNDRDNINEISTQNNIINGAYKPNLHPDIVFNETIQNNSGFESVTASAISTDSDNLNNKITPMHHYNFTKFNDPDSMNESSTQTNTLNVTNEPNLQPISDNVIPSSDTTESGVKYIKNNNSEFEHVTSTIRSYNFTTTSMSVVNHSENIDDIRYQQSDTPMHVQTDKYTSNGPNAMTEDNTVNTKPVQPFDTDLIPDEIYPNSKELPNEDNWDTTASITDSIEIVSLFPATNFPVDVKTRNVGEYNVAPKEESNSTTNYSESVDDLFESSTLPFSTSKYNSSEYKDIYEEKTFDVINITTISDTEFASSAFSSSQYGNVSELFIITTKSQGIFNTQSSSSYTGYKPSSTSQPSEQYKEENIVSDSKTRTSTTEFKDYSTDGPYNNQNISTIPYKNILPEDESTTESFSPITDLIKNENLDDEEDIVQPKETEATSLSPSKITKPSTVQTPSVSRDLGSDNTIYETYPPTISISTTETTKRWVNVTTKENTISDNFNISSTTDNTPPNSVPKIVITNGYYNFSTTQKPLNITSDKIPDQDTSTTVTTNPPKKNNLFYFDNSPYQDNYNEANQKNIPDFDSDIDFPEGEDVFDPKHHPLSTVKPTETFKYFTVAFKKLLESHKTDVHTNNLAVYPKRYYPKGKPQQKLLTNCKNGNQCVRVENHPNVYPTRFHKHDQVSKLDSIYNMPNYIVKSYEEPSKTYSKYFQTSDGKGFQWLPKQILVRQQSEDG